MANAGYVGTPHNSAAKGDIAKGVLMPGDPLRAKFIAENFLTDAKCVNEVRGMLAYTGTYKGETISVMGSGMGMPSISIYAHELFDYYDVDKIIRIGTCGCFDMDIEVGSVFLAQAASTNSNINHRIFNADYAAISDFEMLYTAYNVTKEKGINVKVGNALSSDTFYGDNPEEWKTWARYGVMNVEMEANALFTLAAKFKKRALAMFTISDHILTGKDLTPLERQTALNDMFTIALETIIRT